MSTSQRTFDQVKNILGKLDRNIDAARARRMTPRAAAMPVATPTQPAPTPMMIGASQSSSTAALNQIIGASTSTPAAAPVAASPGMIGQSNGAAPQRSPYGRAQPRARTDTRP